MPTFKRLQKGKQTFYCQEYTKVKKRNSYTIAYSLESYGQILYFTLHNGKPAAMIKQLLISSTQPFSPSKAILETKQSNTKKMIKIDDIEVKVVFVEVSDNVSYVAKLPSTLNVD